MQNPLRWSEWLYGVLLYLYPKRFRATYAREMRLTFRDAARTAYQQKGVGGMVALWLHTLLDLFKTVLEVWVQQGELTMFKPLLIALAGPLTILIGLMWMVIPIADFSLRAGWIRDDILMMLLFLFSFVLSFVPMLLALIGTRLRFYRSVSTLGRIGLTLSMVSCIGVIGAVLASLLFGTVTSELEPQIQAWVSNGTLISLLSIRIGYILFGIDVLKYKLLPRWNGLPLLLGLTIVLSLPMEWFGVPALLPTDWGNPVLHFILSSICWILLGIAMMNPQREPQPNPAI